MEQGGRYHRENGSSYWVDLVKTEKENRDRYVGEMGPVSLITSFSPLGTNEVLGVLGGRRNFLELEEEDLKGLAEALSLILKGYHDLGVSTFNFSIYSGRLGDGDDSFRCFLRVVSRQNVYENYRTDDYFLQKMLRNELILTPPEGLAQILRGVHESL